MKLVLPNKKTFLSLLHFIENLNNLICFEITQDKLTIRIVDKSQVSISILHVYKSYFDKFNVDDVTLGISVDLFLKILKSCQSNTPVEMHYDNKINDSLFIYNNNYEYQMKLFDIEKCEINIPKFDDDVAFTLKNDICNEIFENIIQFSNEICFETKMNTDNIIIRGVESNESMVNVKKKIKVNDKINMNLIKNFKCQYFPMFTKMIKYMEKNDDGISIKLYEDKPILLSYILDDKLELHMHIAPKIDDDEMEDD